MMEKKVPGFCVEVLEALQIFGLNYSSIEEFEDGRELREMLKKKIIQIQKERLVAEMMADSKTDRLLLHNFHFDGNVKSYLLELPFEEARAVFMLRSRMFPTKDNFKGRWGTECVYCGGMESDIHLFSCAGYSDLLGDVDFDLFMTLDTSTEELGVCARKLLKVKERLETFNSSNKKEKLETSD